MVQFRLPMNPVPLPYRLSMGDRIISLGSCFAVHIAKRLSENKFNISINPFGTLYHPLAIKQVLDLVLKEKAFPDHLFLKRDGYYFHFFTHTLLADQSKSSLRTKLNQQLLTAREALKNANWLFLSWGTAQGYYYNDQLVANCHKIPQQSFTKHLVSSKELLQQYRDLLQDLRSFNPSLKILFTLSPVRYIKEGYTANNLSKSICRVAIAQLIDQFEKVYYFPGYELLLDDLRDYRFYSDDLLHPNPQAISYIWDYFVTCACNEPVQEFLKKWERIKKALSHTPFFPESASHQTFLKQTLSKLKELNKSVDVSAEIKSLEDKIT